MSEPSSPPSSTRNGPPIEGEDLSRLIATALDLPKAATYRAGLSREAFSVVADRLVQFLREGGYTVLRPPPKPAHRHPPSIRNPYLTD